MNSEEKNVIMVNDVEITVTNEDIDDIMCTALEGGIDYWCDRVKVLFNDSVKKSELEYASDAISKGLELEIFHEGIESDDPEHMSSVLSKDKFLLGLKLFITKYNVNIIDDKVIDSCMVDAGIADAIIQMAVFNDIIFG